ncbi:MAG: hypothetical protein R3A44_30790 [Caldilineaceae bacterium]
MRIEIDQSGRFEYTRQHTVLAFSNGRQGTILIPAKTKRACIEHIRNRGIKPPRQQTMLFATALYLLVRERINSSTTLVIDKEYFGNEGLVKSHLMNLLSRAGKWVESDQIQFTLIGKTSGAHHLAIATFREQLEPDRIIKLEEMLAEL